MRSPTIIGNMNNFLIKLALGIIASIAWAAIIGLYPTFTKSLSLSEIFRSHTLLRLWQLTAIEIKLTEILY